MPSLVSIQRGHRAAAAQLEVRMRELDNSNRKIDDYVAKELEGTNFEDLEARLEHLKVFIDSQL